MADLINRKALLKELRRELKECRMDGEEFGGESILLAEGIESAIDTIRYAPSVDAVSRAVLDQVRWEREVAISQLEEIGIGFGEKMDGVAKVVRCKDCKHWKHFAHLGCTDFVKVCGLANYMIGANGYCLYGERKEKDDAGSKG